MQLYLEIPPYDTTIQEHHTINKLAQFKYRKELDDKCQWFIVLLYGDLRVVCGTVVWLIDLLHGIFEKKSRKTFVDSHVLKS